MGEVVRMVIGQVLCGIVYEGLRFYADKKRAEHGILSCPACRQTYCVMDLDGPEEDEPEPEEMPEPAPPKKKGKKKAKKGQE